MKASDADLDEALTELAGQAKTYEDKKGKTVKAAEGDQLIDRLPGQAGRRTLRRRRRRPTRTW